MTTTIPLWLLLVPPIQSYSYLHVLLLKLLLINPWVQLISITYMHDMEPLLGHGHPYSTVVLKGEWLSFPSGAHRSSTGVGAPLLSVLELLQVLDRRLQLLCNIHVMATGQHFTALLPICSLFHVPRVGLGGRSRWPIHSWTLSRFLLICGYKDISKAIW